MSNFLKTLLFAGYVLLGFISISCSKCYECTRLIEVEVDKDGDGIPETEFIEDTDDICTANKNDVDDKEGEGWSCS